VVVHSGTQRIERVRADGFSAWVLHDDEADLHATWVPGAGMLGASLVHRGDELLWQGAGIAAYACSRTFMGVPFLYPWANRLGGYRYRAGAHDVTLDPAWPSLKLDDHGLPIHGVLTASTGWTVSESDADHGRARLVASLEFDTPELLGVFPFAHRVEMAVELAGGALEVRTTVQATGPEAVPVAFGFHPYLQIPGVPRAQWRVSFPVLRRLEHDARLIPTGDTEPTRPLRGAIGQRTWDDGFDRFDGPARFDVRAGGRALQVEFVSGYPIAQIFAPPEQEYVCVEPMTAPANALAGPDDALTWVPPGERHSAAFRITPTLAAKPAA
jgi:galactose mutarotase-like enzyme